MLSLNQVIKGEIMFSEGGGEMPPEETKSEESKLEEKMESEEIKLKIDQLFEEIGLEITDIETSEAAERQREKAASYLRLVQDGVKVPEAVMAELAQYSIILEDIVEKISDPNEYRLAQMKASVMKAKLQFECGRVRSAFHILASDDDLDEGVYYVARVMKKDSEELGNFYKKLCDLIDLIEGYLMM